LALKIDSLNLANRLYKLLIVILVGACISGCALPRDPYKVQQVVPTREIQIASFVREGLDLLSRGRNMDAEFSLRRAYYLAPDSPTIKRSLAVVLGRQGVFAESEQLFLELLDKNPDSLSTLSSLALMYFDQRLYEKARERYLEIIERALDSEEVRVQKIRAETYRSLSVLEFTVGNEEAALCFSLKAIEQARVKEDEKIRHARILNSYGMHDHLIALLGRQGIQSQNSSEVHQVMLAQFARKEFKDAIKGALRISEDKAAAAEASADARWIEVLTLLKTKPEAELIIFNRAEQLEIRDPMEIDSKGITEEEVTQIEQLADFVRGERLKSNPRMLYWPQILAFEALRLQQDLELIDAAQN